MKVLNIVLVGAIFSLTSAASAQEGTREQREACSPDVRKYCRTLGQGASSQDYYSCLKTNRARLSVKCRAVIDGA